MTGTDLRTLRLKLGMTQKAMADKLGVSYATYSRYELGKWPLNKTVKILREALARET